MARHKNGWIKLHRKLDESDIGRNGFCLAVWTRLLLMATREETTIRWNGGARRIPPGSVVLGLRSFADELGFSKNTVARWLKHLSDRDTIGTEGGTEGTLVTIKNWRVYQSNYEGVGTREGHERDAGGDTAGDTRGYARVDTRGAPNEEVRSKKEEEREASISPESIRECIEEWANTLRCFGIERNPSSDEFTIARLIQIHGTENARLALLGARFEDGSKDYDPKKHVSIRRLLKPDVFDKFVNLGAQNRGIVREVYNPPDLFGTETAPC